ncbi:hypothetical protein DC366_13920 [Pelagivirga sediminicola]|uniref:Uncharacterized protein n=1 Tax=Pelagivirga sediminicola TaxID=2170575 RepID=A0A2T7G4Y6_9RHOB|nr:hypothetical protein [Pelagivirga sediminicola]PVA09479.1 hypothetical protein DC366_13920 [Pelagivirga sediminicola]
MTALSEYQRLEASGLWRSTPGDQRCEVVVSIGDATLVITDMRDRALTHWSIPAVVRANPGQIPAIYHPDGDTGETLELDAGERQMIDAIEKLRAGVARLRPRPGRLRLMMMLGSMAAAAALAVFWLPGAVRDHALRVVPPVKRAQIGAALEAQMQSVTGPPCRAPAGTAALTRLAERLPAKRGTGALRVVRGGVRTTATLPGGTILLHRSLVEDFEEPDVVAGYIVAERVRARAYDPLGRLLDHADLIAAFRLLTTGEPGQEALRSYAEYLLTDAPAAPLDDAALLSGFQAWSVRSTPYAYARDITGETTLGLIEADPFTTEVPPALLSDGDWLRLQGICGS